jgi:hypothetical protein
MTYIEGEGRERSSPVSFLVGLINSVLNALMESFFEGTAPQQKEV